MNQHEINLFGTLGDENVNAKLFSMQVKAMKLAPGDELALHINSTGGAVIEGNTIISQIKRLQAKSVKVSAIIDGVCCSMMSCVVSVCNQVSMSEHALYMIHNPSGFAAGTASEISNTVKVLESLAASMSAYYQQKTGKTGEEITMLMNAETWMTADEALENGFIDEIVQGGLSPEYVALSKSNILEFTAMNNVTMKVDADSLQAEVAALRESKLSQQREFDIIATTVATVTAERDALASELSVMIAERLKQDNIAFVDGLIAEGKFMPSERESCLSMLTKQTNAELLVDIKAFMTARPIRDMKRANYTNTGVNDGVQYKVDPLLAKASTDSLDLDKRIRELAAKQGIAYAEAANIVVSQMR